MNSLLLTDDERQRFADYLERDIESSKLLIDQMMQIHGMDAVIAKAKQEMLASLIVVRRLRNTTSETMGVGQCQHD